MWESFGVEFVSYVSHDMPDRFFDMVYIKFTVWYHIYVLHPLLGLLIDVIELTFSHFANISRAFQNSYAATYVWSDSLMLPSVHIAQSLAVSHVLR